MPVDAYAPCPCGSGKKFKWCCQPFYHRIEKAFEQNVNGQHEAALRTMEQLCSEFPNSPEVWGKRAELLWENQRLEEAEKVLEKALEINPNYAFAYFLRGMFRHDERELRGALQLYRKAAELCDPEARDLMSEIHGSIGQCEVMLNRPLAARAAWQIALRFHPSEPVQRYMAECFGPRSELPSMVCRDYGFKSPPQDMTPAKRAAWEASLAKAQTGRLTDAAAAFAELTKDSPGAAAWYNLGLVRAWLGDNAGALEAWDSYVAGEPDEDAAADAWALTEVLRFGDGMDSQRDCVEHVALYRILDARAAAEAIPKERRIASLQEHGGVIGGTILTREMPPANPNLAAYELPRVAAYLVLMGDQLRLLNTDKEMLEQGRQIIESLFGPAISEPHLAETAPPFHRLLDEALSVRIPSGLAEDHARRLLDQHLQQYFEETWIRRPRKSLNQIPAVDAAGHPVLRKKLTGLIRFLEDVARSALPLPYDFDRLRHKLGLSTTKPAGEPTPTAAANISAMSAADLSTLEAGKLSDDDVEKAFQAAVRLDARELAGEFARAAVARPARAEHADRFPLYQHLIHLALDDDDPAEAGSWVDAGLKEDCEMNEGRRRNDYELRRAHVHLAKDEPEIAHDVFTRVIQRVPSDLKVLGSAAEAMLSARLPHHAAAFAEQGLAQARKKGDRDHAGYFQELLAAAKRQN